MKARYLFILFIMLGVSLQADAQRKSKPRAKKTVQKKATAKKPVAKPKPTAKAKANAAKAAAADTSLKGATIEIIQNYKPEIKKALKPELSTNLPPVDTTAPRFNYEVPQQTLSYTYSSFPLKPLALGMDSLNTPFANYVKLGGGNLSTFYLDAGIGSLKGEDFETNFHLDHLSQVGDIKYQQSSLTSFSAEGVQHRNGNAWHANFNALHNQYYYYGYDHSAYTFQSDSIKQAYTGIRFGLDLQNELEGISGFDYHPFINLSLYNDRFDGAENTFSLGLPVAYNIDTSLQLLMGVSGIFTNYKKPFFTQNNNVIQLSPGLRYKQGSFTGRGMINIAFGQNSNYLLPDIDTRFKIRGSQFTFLAGWQALLRQNTFEQLSTRNPYMYDKYVVNQTRTDEIFAGLQTNIGTHLSVTGRASWWRYGNLPLFINDTLTDSKQFLIVYDTLTAISLQGSLRYQVASTFAVGFSAMYTNYSPSNQKRAWHEPGLTFKGDLVFKPFPALTVTGYLTVMDEIYALKKGNKVEKLSPVLDLGGSAEYSFLNRLSAFINVNNLLNNKYERWMGYQAYGLNVYGGVRLKF